MMRQIHVGDIEIDNKIENTLRKTDTVLPNMHTVTVEYSRLLAHLKFSKHQTRTFNQNSGFFCNLFITVAEYML